MMSPTRKPEGIKRSLVRNRLPVWDEIIYEVSASKFFVIHNAFYIKGICCRLKMSEPGCALPFTSGPHKATHLSMCDRTCYGSDLVAKTLFSDFVGVQSCATAACNCTNKPASLTPH